MFNYCIHYQKKILQNQILKILIERDAKFDSESNGIGGFKIGRLHLEKFDFSRNGRLLIGYL
jgi:hypothetical protein